MNRASIKTIAGEEGFSLTEILIVIVIIGILVLLAMPKFTAVVTRAKTTEAKMMLKHLLTLEKAYYFENDRYSSDLVKIGFEPALLVTEGGEARYRIEIIQANELGFIAMATAVVDFDGDGIFNIWEVDETGRIVQKVLD